MDEYQKIYNMGVNERMDFLKKSTPEYKKAYMKYERNEKKQLKKSNLENADNNKINTDPLLSKNGRLFAEKIDNFFNTKKNIKNDNFINDIIDNTYNIKDVEDTEYIGDTGGICDIQDIEDIQDIKNYNLKIPIKTLPDIYLKLPFNLKKSIIINGEYLYIYF